MINFSVDEFLSKIKHENLAERYCLFITGVYLYALGFSLIFDKYNIVSGGCTGLAIILRNMTGIETTIITFILSFIVLAIGYFTLGKEYTINTIFGVILLPICMYAASIYEEIINFENTSMFALMIYGGLITGFANGLIVKTGFSSGGVQTISQILNKYFGISIGNGTFIINVVIILIGVYTFGIVNAIYACIAQYIASIIMDKVILGISDSKAFYIITDKEQEIKEYIIGTLHHSITLLDARGGYTNQKKKVLLCVIPTREYLKAKEVISEIDKDAFYIVTDSYEVLGGY